MNCTSRTGRRGDPYPRSEGSPSNWRAGRCWGSPVNPAAASQRSPARSCGSCPKARTSPVGCSLDDQNVLELKPGKLRAVRWTEASIVFQGAMHALNPVQRIGDQIAEPIILHGQAGEREALVRAGSLLEQVGLPARRLRDYPHELSGGQRQRVMIAMALACSPRLIIADEPTTALDVMVQAQVLRLLKELQRELGLAMIFITHDLSVLVETCDRLAVMYAGRIIEEGAADTVFRQPAPPVHASAVRGLPRDRGRSLPRCTRPVSRAIRPIPPTSPPAARSIRRCPDVFDPCSTVDPPLFDVSPGRRAACLLLDAGRASLRTAARADGNDHDLPAEGQG